MDFFSALAFVFSRWKAKIYGTQKIETEPSITHIAEGGYHNVFLLNFPPNAKKTTYKGIEISLPPGRQQAILRVRIQKNNDNLSFLQIRNEVGIRKYLTAKSNIPTPEIYAWNDGQDGREAFILEEYIEGPTLNDAWAGYTQDQQQDIIVQLAKILVDLAETRFDKIGSLDPVNQSFTPNVELGKRYEGRAKLHDSGCYDVGPYSTTRDYVAAMMDKEIAYAADLPEDYFDDDHDEEDDEWLIERRKEVEAEQKKLLSDRGHDNIVSYLKALREKMLQQMDKQKSDAEAKAEANGEPKPKEVFTISHGDIAGRNIMMRGPKIAALIDWEWAMILPISEFWTCGCAHENRIELMGAPVTIGERELNEEEEALTESYWEDLSRAEENLKDAVEQEADARQYADNECWQNGELLDLLWPRNNILNLARDIVVDSIARTAIIEWNPVSDEEATNEDQAEMKNDDIVKTVSENGSDAVTDGE